MELHPQEIKILKVLNKDELSLKEIAKKVNTDITGVGRVINWLKTKNLVNVNEKIYKEISLNDEGKIYKEKGLPERQIINFLKENNIKEISINDLKKISEEKNLNFGIVFGWLKKKNHIIVKNNVVILVDDKERDDEILIKLLPKEIEKEDETINLLKSRKILNIKERKEIFVSISEEGIKEKEKIKDLEYEEEISQLTPEIIKNKEWVNKKFRKYNIKDFVSPQHAAKVHPLTKYINEIREIFIGMGFKEVVGNFIESTFWDFDCLFQPQDHPARDMQDTFYLKNFKKDIEKFDELKDKIKNIHEKQWKYEWNENEAKKFILRTHTTAVSAHCLSNLKKDELPVKIFSIGKVFRNETIDFKHLPEFYQVEGIVVDENANFRNLLWILKNFYEKLGFKKIRFRPAYFPYTEMSIEPEVYLEDRKQWIELGGAGIFRSEVVEPLLGFYCPVLAWGLGLDRIVALKLNLNDIRELYISDIDWLRSDNY